MYVKDDMGAVRDEYPSLGVQAMLLERLELLEEARHVDDTATSDDIDAAGVHETAGQDVEVVGNSVRDDGVAGVVTALGAAADLRLVGKNVGKLALAFVAPLGAEDNGDGHREDEGRGRRRQCGGRWVFNCPWRKRTWPS